MDGRVFEHRVGSEKELLALCKHIEPFQSKGLAHRTYDKIVLAELANREAKRYGYRDWQHALKELSKWSE